VWAIYFLCLGDAGDSGRLVGDFGRLTFSVWAIFGRLYRLGDSGRSSGDCGRLFEGDPSGRFRAGRYWATVSGDCSLGDPSLGDTVLGDNGRQFGATFVRAISAGEGGRPFLNRWLGDFGRPSVGDFLGDTGRFLGAMFWATLGDEAPLCPQELASVGGRSHRGKNQSASARGAKGQGCWAMVGDNPHAPDPSADDSRLGDAGGSSRSAE
jgi:hypothetical protein